MEDKIQETNIDKTLQNFNIYEVVDYLSQEDKKSMTSIALQFCDSDLQHSTKIYRYLRDAVPDKMFYVLGDTSYSECCIDDVNASHAKHNDMIIKFGQSCFSTSSKSLQRSDKELLYVVQTENHEFIQIQISKIKEWISLNNFEEVDIHIYSDLKYYQQVAELIDMQDGQLNFGYLDFQKYQIIPKSLQKQKKTSESQYKLLNRLYDNKQKNKKILIFIGDFDYNLYLNGDEEQKLTNYIVPNLSTQEFSQLFYISSLEEDIQEFKEFKKWIQKRYANIERVNESQIIGILIGTVVCDNHMLIIDQLKRQLINRNKKYYEVLIGKINEPKLKNFQFIDMYIIIACPEMSIVTFKKWNIHVVTPHEALMALEPDSYPWSSQILTDYNLLLKDDIQQNNDDLFDHEYKEGDMEQIAVSNQNRELIPIFSSQVISRYEQFTYKGLQADIKDMLKNSIEVDEDGNKKFVKIETGLNGIASSYKGEKEQKFEQL